MESFVEILIDQLIDEATECRAKSRSPENVPLAKLKEDSVSDTRLIKKAGQLLQDSPNNEHRQGPSSCNQDSSISSDQEKRLVRILSPSAHRQDRPLSTDSESEDVEIISVKDSRPFMDKEKHRILMRKVETDHELREFLTSSGIFISKEKSLTNNSFQLMKRGVTRYFVTKLKALYESPYKHLPDERRKINFEVQTFLNKSFKEQMKVVELANFALEFFIPSDLLHKSIGKNVYEGNTDQANNQAESRISANEQAKNLSNKNTAVSSNSTGNNLVASFPWFSVESSYFYSIVNSSTRYIIHTAKAMHSNQFHGKLFIEENHHKNISTNCIEWSNVSFILLATDALAMLRIGETSISVVLPSKYYEVHSLVQEKKPFILSHSRVQAFQNTMITDHSLSLCDFYFSSRGQQKEADVNNLGCEWQSLNKDELKNMIDLTYGYIIKENIDILACSGREFEAAFYVHCVDIALTKYTACIKENAFFVPENIYSLVAPNWCAGVQPELAAARLSSASLSTSQPMVSRAAESLHHSATNMTLNVLPSSEGKSHNKVSTLAKPIKAVAYESPSIPLPKLDLVSRMRLAQSIHHDPNYDKLCDPDDVHEGNEARAMRLFEKNVNLITQITKTRKCVFCTYEGSGVKQHLLEHLRQKFRPDYLIRFVHGTNYFCEKHGPFHDAISFLTHVCQSHEDIMHELLARCLFGKSLFQCGYPECYAAFALPEEYLQKHLYQIHLKNYIEKEMIIERTKNSSSSSVCPIPLCGFPMFLDQSVLLQHFAFFHKKVNSVYRQFCKYNRWYYDDLKKNNFFVEPSFRSKLRKCTKCQADVNEEYLALHQDQCSHGGKHINRLSELLGIKGELDIQFFTSTIHACPFTECAHNCNFNDLLFHCFSKHDLVNDPQGEQSPQHTVPEASLDEAVPTREKEITNSSIACPLCNQKFVMRNNPDLMILFVHLKIHLSSEKYKEFFNYFLTTTSRMYKYSGPGCPIQSCSQLKWSHKHLLTVHLTEMSLLFLYLRLNRSDLLAIETLLTSHSKQFLELLNQTLKKTSEDLSILEIDVIPVRSGHQKSKFLQECEGDQMFEQDLMARNLLHYEVLKRFFLYLVGLKTANNEDLVDEVRQLSAQTDHVLMFDEVYVVKDLFEFEYFQQFWKSLRLFRRFYIHCNENKAQLRTCHPMQVVIMMSQFSKDESVVADDIANFLSVENELHFLNNGKNLIDMDIVKEFVKFQKLDVQKIFALTKDHLKFMSCTECFQVDCYFPNIKEVQKHVQAHHDRKKPAKIACIRCYKTRFINVTSDEGSLHNLQSQMNLHATSTGHLRTIFGLCPSAQFDGVDCFLCNISTVSIKHVNSDSHQRLSVVLEFYLNTCARYSVNPFECRENQFYIFVAKLMVSVKRMRATCVSDLDKVVRRFQGENYVSISSVTEPEYLSSVGFCFLCQVAFRDRNSVEKHLESSCKEVTRISADQLIKEKPYFCVLCEDFFPKHEMSNHLQHFEVRKPSGFDCLQCDEVKIYTGVDDVLHHLKEMHSPSGNKVHCTKCGIIIDNVDTTENFNSLELHKNIHQKISSDQDNLTITQDVPLFKRVKPSRVNISFEERKLANSSYQRDSAESVKESEEFECIYQCLHCQDNFSSPAELQNHYRLYHCVALPPDSETRKLPGSECSPNKRMNSSIESSRYVKRPKEDSCSISQEENLSSSLQQESEEYFYFCNDCERERGYTCGVECKHFSHSRIPIGWDIAGHMTKTGHTSVEPIHSYVPLSLQSSVLQVQNLSYCKSYGHTIRRRWKSLISQGIIRESIYEENRACLRCGDQFEDALKMFLHIKEHLT